MNIYIYEYIYMNILYYIIFQCFPPILCPFLEDTPLILVPKTTERPSSSVSPAPPSRTGLVPAPERWNHGGIQGIKHEFCDKKHGDFKQHGDMEIFHDAITM
jgi:hypothetical protein